MHKHFSSKIPLLKKILKRVQRFMFHTVYHVQKLKQELMIFINKELSKLW